MSLYEMYMIFPCPSRPLRKNSVSFLVFSMSHCIYVASVAHYYYGHRSLFKVCTSLIVLKIHVLPFSCFLHHFSMIFCKLTLVPLLEGVHLNEVCLTTGLCDQYHTHGHQMSLHVGWVRLAFCVLGSQPAATGQAISHVTRYQPVRLWVGQICGGRGTMSLTTLGPSPGSQHSYWFSLGSDLPYPSQASDTNELCNLLYTFGTMLNDHLHFCIYTA